MALYETGLSTYEIADQFGVSPTPIARILREQGAALRVGGQRANWTGTPEQRAQVVAWYQAGESVMTIGRRLRCRYEYITQALEEAEIVLRARGAERRALTTAQAADAAKAYEAGALLTDLAAKYHTSTVTIRNYLAGQGVKLRPGGAPRFWTDERRTEAVRRYQGGESQQSIADSMGISQKGVSATLRGLGVSTRKPQWHRTNPNWKGGRYVDGNGYVQVIPSQEDMRLVPMMATGYVLEHRLIMARILGRSLLKTETVHHIDGDKLNNAPENLQLRQGKHGKGVVLRCADCGSHNVEAVPLT